MKKTVAITGANGFVGRSLSTAWKDKYNIINITRNSFNLLDLDETAHFFDSNRIDVVVHCANEGGSRKTAYDSEESNIINRNISMLTNLLQCRNRNTRLISFGSGAEYNKQKDLCKVSENLVGNDLPTDSYGKSKLKMHEILKTQDNCIEAIIFGLYGKYEDYRFKFISNSIIKNILRMSITIKQNVKFDYLFIDDLIEIIDYYVNEDVSNKCFNITPSESITLQEITTIINEISTFRSEIIIENKGMNYEYTGDNTNLLSDIGHYKFTSYHEGIKKLYRYFIDNLSKINTEEIAGDNYYKYCKIRL